MTTQPESILIALTRKIHVKLERITNYKNENKNKKGNMKKGEERKKVEQGKGDRKRLFVSN